MRSIILFASFAFLMLGCSKASTQNVSNSSQDSSTPKVGSTPRYSEQLSGRGENENGVPFSFHTYKGPNSEKVSTKFEAYESGDEGEKRFDQIVKSSAKVIEQGPLFDRNRSRVGNRAILQIRRESSGVEWKLLLLNASKIYIVESNSVETLQDFEKEFVPSIFANVLETRRDG